jgi:hypothetical protein
VLAIPTLADTSAEAGAAIMVIEAAATLAANKVFIVFMSLVSTKV